MTSYNSSEEENIPYLRKFAQNTRNHAEGPKLFEDTADEHAVDHFASSENIVPRFQASSVLSPLPPGLVPKSPWIKSSTASAEEFYYNFLL